jgi:PAS domain-containing protein
MWRAVHTGGACRLTIAAIAVLPGESMVPRFLTAFNGESETRAAPSLESQVEQLTHDRYQALANSADTAVYTCDTAGVILYYNNRAAEIWGRKPVVGDTHENFCGASVLYRPDGSRLTHEHCPMADVLSGKVPGAFDVEVSIERLDGSRVSVVMNIAPLINGDNEVVGAVNSFYENPLHVRVLLRA